jgi:hypothetical protein
VSETGPVVNIPAPEGQILGNPLSSTEFEPGLNQTVAATVAATPQALAESAQYQRDTERFISEHGAAVVGGHAPVGMEAQNPGGEADFGGPGNSGASDNTGATTVGN